MKCPGCKTAFDFDNSLEGNRIKCKSCGDIFRVEKPTKNARDEDDDRPLPARRRGEEDDRPTTRTRRFTDEEDQDERPVSRSRRDKEDDDLPHKRKMSPLLIIGPIAGFALVLVVVAFFVFRGKKKEGVLEPGDIVQASSKSCTL